MINLIMISAIVCFIVDISGIIDTLKHFLWKKYIKVGDWHNLSLKPLDCSLCMVFHTGWIYLLIVGQFTLFNFAFVCLLSLLSSNISDLERYLKDFLVWLTNLLYKLIGQ